MLDNTARCVYEVYRLKSVSNAANELFISQPAISAAIRKAERAYGSPIFNRKTLPFTLTEEGKIYIKAIEQMLRIEEQASAQLQDLKEIQSGTLRIASGDPLSYRVIPKIVRLFHEKYPQVDIHVMETDAARIHELLDKDLADVSFSPLEFAQGNHPATPLFRQRSVVVIPHTADIPQELRNCTITRQALVDGSFPPEKLVKDYPLFQNIPFIHIASIPFITKRRTQLFGKYEIAPHITSSTGQTYMNYNLMRSGFGALLTTDAQIAVIPPDPDCLYFALGGPNALQAYSVAYSDKSLSQSLTPLQAFVDTAKAFFDCENPLQKIIEP